jgi:hypothetical protein
MLSNDIKLPYNLLSKDIMLTGNMLSNYRLSVIKGLHSPFYELTYVKISDNILSGSMMLFNYMMLSDKILLSDKMILYDKILLYNLLPDNIMSRLYILFFFFYL